MRITTNIAIFGICLIANPALAETKASISQQDRGFTIIASQSEQAVYACNYTVQIVFRDGFGSVSRAVRVGGSTEVSGSGANMAVVTSHLEQPIRSATLKGWQCVFKKAL